MKHFPDNRATSNAQAITSIFAVALMVCVDLHGAQSQRTFATPEEAATALASAVNSTNYDDLGAIFGPEVARIQNTDRVQAANDFTKFSVALNQTNYLVRPSGTRCVLTLGDEAWPFPVPIVQKDGRWLFDTAAGVDEILDRRIGGNELATLQIVRAYVEAQREYASRDRDDDQVLEYAQKIISSPGAKDGLFWSPDIDDEISPLGPLFADAAAEGYGKKSRNADAEPQPFHGYFFKVLTRQDKAAPGGKYDYIINGNMIGGFALVAWPAAYGDSGVMTFIVNQQGRVYQKDLGKKTASLAQKMKAYDPDASWQVSAD